MVEELVQQYLSQMTAEQTLKSDAYFEGGYWFLLWELIIGAAIAWLLLFKGWSAKFRDWSKKVTRFSYVHDLVYYSFYAVSTTIIVTPWTLYKGYFREHQYGLSNLTLPEFAMEQFKGLVIGLIIGSIMIATLYAIVRKLKNTWWVWGSLVTVGFMAFFMLVFPVFVAPVFNTYKPLDEGPLKAEILSMARANGIDAKEIYQFDASKQSKRISANVSGLAGTMRISLNDNLLNRTSPEEIRAVMGHEIGHYVLNHIYEMLIYFGLIFVIGFAFIHYAGTGVIRKWGDKMQVESISDTAGLPLAMFLITIYFVLATPFTNSIIRSNEVEADVFGLNAAREPDGFAKVALKLSEYRKISPGYWEEIFFFDHPSGENRIRAAMKWKVENLVEKVIPEKPTM